jgi:hypothetical protein
MISGTAVFLDTSIQIARFVHAEETKQRIRDRLSHYSITLTGEIVRQEFKRRLLREAKYLLELVDKHNSLEDVYHRILRLPRQQQPKQKICLLVFSNVFKDQSQAERVERFKLYLHHLLTAGISDFEESVTHVVKESNCYCAKTPIEEKKRYKRYEFGTYQCSRTPRGSCGIVRFIQERLPQMKAILARLQTIPAEKKSPQLQEAEKFINKVLENPDAATSMDPCHKFGDLMIALESMNATAFYTLNGKESQHLCRVLNQDLIVRPLNPEHEDVECLRANDNWQEF